MEYKIYECRPPTRTRMQSGSASHPLQENTVTNSMSTSRISQCIPFIKHFQSPGSRHLWARLGFWEYAIPHGLLPNSGYKDLRASQTLVCWTNIFHIIIFKLFKKWLDGFKIPSLSSHFYISTRFLRKKINNAQKLSSKIPPPIHPPLPPTNTVSLFFDAPWDQQRLQHQHQHRKLCSRYQTKPLSKGLRLLQHRHSIDNGSSEAMDNLKNFSCSSSDFPWDFETNPNTLVLLSPPTLNSARSKTQYITIHKALK